MAYKKDIKPWLKENGYKWEDMNIIWEECCEVNWKCKMIKQSGKSWSDMTMYQIQQLPTLKETTLKQIKQKEMEKKLKEAKLKLKEAKLKEEKKDTENYWNNFDEVMVQKIDDCENLTKKEIKAVVYETHEIERIYGEKLRWTRSVVSIVEMCGRYFRIEWEEGLTEIQEDVFYCQPYEVVKNTYEKTITVTEWNKK